MKKILVAMLGILLFLTGCGGNQNQDVKEQAIQAYIDTSNTMVDSFIKVDMSANINVPRSMLVTDEVNLNVNLSGHIDVKNTLMHFTGSVTSPTNTMENQNFEIYMDQNYIYIYENGQWMKAANDNNEIASIHENLTGLNTQEATEMFDQLRNVQYTQSTRDGVSGYVISGTIDKAILENILQAALATLTPEQTQGIDLSQINLNMINQLDINLNTFIAGDHSFIEIFDSSVNVNVMMVGANITDLNVKTSRSNEPVVIPQAALNAPVVSTPALPGGSN